MITSIPLLNSFSELLFRFVSFSREEFLPHIHPLIGVYNANKIICAEQLNAHVANYMAATRTIVHMICRNDDIWKRLGKERKPKWKKKSNNLYCVGLFIHCNHSPPFLMLSAGPKFSFVSFESIVLTLNQNDWHWTYIVAHLAIYILNWNLRNCATFGLRCYIFFPFNDKNQLRNFYTLSTHFAIQSRIWTQTRTS